VKNKHDEDRLVDLALEWNYIDGVLPILQSRLDAMRKKGREYSEVRFYLLKVLELSFYSRKRLNVTKNYLKILLKRIVQHLLNIFLPLVLIHVL
jgi:hypothetical protein